MLRRFLGISLGTALFAFALYVVMSGWHMSAVTDIMAQYGSATAATLPMAFLIYFVFNRFLSPTLRKIPVKQFYGPWHRHYVADFPFVTALVGFVSLVVTVASFTAFKTVVLPTSGYGLDEVFVAWDRALFGGHDPWKISHAVFSTATATKWLDILYHPTFLPMVVGYLLCLIARANPALRYTYMATYLVSWVVVAMVMAYALSSGGPVFDGSVWGDGSTFADLNNRLAVQSDVAGPFFATRGQDYLLDIFQSGGVAFGTGISAMPSMHIALAYLWALGGWHIHRGLGIALGVYTILIWIGSVHLAWHYAVDGIVSVVVVYVLWRLIGRYLGLYVSRA